MLIVPHALHCVDGSCFFSFTSLYSLAYCFGFNVFSTFPPPPPPTPASPTFNPTICFLFRIGFFVKLLLLDSSKLVGVGFALKTLFTHFEMLIVSHALHCVNDHYLYSISFDSLVNCLVSVLDYHKSVKQLMSIRNLKEWQYVNFMCFAVHQAF